MLLVESDHNISQILQTNYVQTTTQQIQQHMVRWGLQPFLNKS